MIMGELASWILLLVKDSGSTSCKELVFYLWGTLWVAAVLRGDLDVKI